MPDSRQEPTFAGGSRVEDQVISISIAPISVHNGDTIHTGMIKPFAHNSSHCSPDVNAVAIPEIRKLVDNRYFQCFPTEIPRKRQTEGRKPGYYKAFDQSSEEDSDQDCVVGIVKNDLEVNEE